MATDVLERRFAAQLLGERLLAVQAQDLRSARLAIRGRTSGATREGIDRCLDDRHLVIGWLNRGTLHLVRRQDYWWLHGLTTPPLFTGNARRLQQCGVSPAAADRGVAVIARALVDGPQTRDQLAARVEAARVPTAGQALVHLLMLACLRGVAVRGPFTGGRHAYVAAEDWIGPRRPVARDRALAQLARRYLIGHAPADDRDVAKWAGLPLRDARAGLRSIERQLRRREDGLFELEDHELDGSTRPCLLDQWDPVLVGWRSRVQTLAYYLGRDSAGTHFRPFAYVRGRAVATWATVNGDVRLGEPFIHLSRLHRRALEADATAVGSFLGQRERGTAL